MSNLVGARQDFTGDWDNPWGIDGPRTERSLEAREAGEGGDAADPFGVGMLCSSGMRG